MTGEDLLKKHVIGAYGDKGIQWLAELPNTIQTLADKWHLYDIKPITFPSYNYVAFCMQKPNIAAVLKISPDAAHIANEIKTHNYFAGAHTVQLLAEDVSLGAVLLERAVPGDVLKALPRDEAILIYADVVQTMHAHPKSIVDTFTTIYEWFKTLDRIESPLIDTKYIDRAKQLIEKYYHDQPSLMVCHGDLHLQNIIAHGDRYINIDPKGVLGDIEFEVSSFDLITEQELQRSDAQHIMSDRIKQLADLTGCDVKKLTDWFFLRSLIHAQWFIEDQGDPTERLQYLHYLY